MIEHKNKLYQVITTQYKDGSTTIFIETPLKEIEIYNIKKALDQLSDILLSGQQLFNTTHCLNPQQNTLGTELQEKYLSQIEEERRAFVNYLHDDILQTTIALNTLTTNPNNDVISQDTIKIEYAKFIHSIRQKIANVSPITMQYQSMNDHLIILFEQLNRHFIHTTFQFNTIGDEKIPQHMVAPIFRIIKELNENVGKHAHAELAFTTIEYSTESIFIMVEDNGTGIKNLSIFQKKILQRPTHMGLISVKKDIDWLNGSLSFQSFPVLKKGLSISIELPLKNKMR